MGPTRFQGMLPFAHCARAAAGLVSSGASPNKLLSRDAGPGRAHAGGRCPIRPPSVGHGPPRAPRTSIGCAAGATSSGRGPGRRVGSGWPRRCDAAEGTPMPRWGVRAIALGALVVLAGCAAPPRVETPRPVVDREPAACRRAADCGATTPACVDGMCGPCRDDGDCALSEGCRVCGTGGACVPAEGCCRGDLDCPGSFLCLRAAGTAVGRCADEKERP